MKMLLAGEGRGWWDSGSRPRPEYASEGLCSLLQELFLPLLLGNTTTASSLGGAVQDGVSLLGQQSHPEDILVPRV